MKDCCCITGISRASTPLCYVLALLREQLLVSYSNIMNYADKSPGCIHKVLWEAGGRQGDMIMCTWWAPSWAWPIPPAIPCPRAPASWNLRFLGSSRTSPVHWDGHPSVYFPVLAPKQVAGQALRGFFTLLSFLLFLSLLLFKKLAPPSFIEL